MKRVLCSLLILVPIWVVVFHTTLLDLLRVWGSSKTYEHGYLILPISLWLMWEARDRFDLQRSHYSMSAIWWVVASVMIWLFGQASNVNMFAHIGAVMALQGVFWFVLGNANAKVLWFPLLFLLFAVPFGEELVPRLQIITADFTVAYLNFVNIPVYRDGLYLYIPNGSFHVAEACSGIRFLISGTALGALFSYLFFTHPIKRIIYFVVAISIPIIANGIRAFGIVVVGYLSDMKYATGADHLIYGWVFFSFVIMVMLGVAYRLGDAHKGNQIKPSTAYCPPSFRSQLSMIIIAGSVLSAGYLWDKLFLNDRGITTLAHGKLSSEKDAFEWGIHFKDPVSIRATKALGPLPHSAYHATYHLAQQKGKVLSSDNQLFDNSIWQVQASRTSSIGEHSVRALRLNSTIHAPMTVVYWYCVEDFCSAKPTEIALYSGLIRLFKGDGKASITAIASRGFDFDSPEGFSRHLTAILDIAQSQKE